MKLAPFPDPVQVRILQFLQDNCHGSSRPIDGWDAHALLEELSIPCEDLRVPVSDLEDRGCVITGLAHAGNPIGRVVITSYGRDVLHDIRATPKRQEQAAKAARRHRIWEIAKLVLAAFLGALFFFVLQVLYDWIR